MSGESVKVVVRCRPMNTRERDLKCEIVVEMNTKINQVFLKSLDEPNSPPKQFTFDGAYYLDSVTETIYNDVGFPLVESVCEGYNGTIFAYGQTGCGKSFTMQGVKDPPIQKGMIPRAFEHIFEAAATDSSKKYLIRASYLEIYNENIRDLLSKEAKTALELHEHPEKGVYVNDLSWHECKKYADCEKLMDKGNKNRMTGATLMNADSSRSHSIFTICVEMCEKESTDGEDHFRVGKLNLVDLAGSERQSKTGATGDRLKEATKINLSLSALGNVISALVDGKSKHIPYRDSKLTRLLQDSLGGNTKTLMIAAVSPAADNYDETLSTLRYANRAKNIKNKPKINEDPKDAQLRMLQEEINRLKAQLTGGVAGAAVLGLGSTISMNQSNSDFSRELIEEEKRKLKEEYESKIAQIKLQYEQERTNKESVLKEMDKIKENYERDLSNLDKTKRKSSKSSKSAQKREELTTDNEVVTQSQEPNEDDPAKILEKLEQLIVGGEQANNEELKKKRNKKKTYVEERKRMLQEALKNGDDSEFMLKVYDSVQDEVKYNSNLLEKEKVKNKFLESEIKDLQREFERERADFLETFRKNDREIKLLNKILSKIQTIIPFECNYYSLDRIKLQAQWKEDIQDWLIPEMKKEKLSLPTMNNGQQLQQSQMSSNDDYYDEDYEYRQISHNEPDRYRLKLEQSNYDSSSYFKNKRQTELLQQKNDLSTLRQTNGRLSPLRGNNYFDRTSNKRY